MKILVVFAVSGLLAYLAGEGLVALFLLDKKHAMHKAFVAACEKAGGAAVFNSREWVCLK